MKQKWLVVLVMMVIVIGASSPEASDTHFQMSIEGSYAPSLAGNVSDVPYVWQELNGFCHWAAYSMILQSTGVPLDLHDVFAATGIGFTASYLRVDRRMVLYPGPFFPQMPSTFAVEEIFGLNVTMGLDRSLSELAGIFADNLESFGIEFTEINGFDEAYELLKHTIDSGYPFEIWTDPYHLPPWDYDILRDIGLQYDGTGAGHAIVATGYNETAGTVHIFDPGVGAYGDIAYPSDGRYSYDLNLTQLDTTWKPLFYGCFIAEPGEGTPADFTTRLGNYILNRMRGDRSYLVGMEEAFYWILGSDAYRGLAYDLTESGLASYVDEFGGLTTSQKSQVLQGLGLVIEGFLALEHLSFRTAIQALPDLLPNLDLTKFVTAGADVVQYLDEISDNGTLANIDYAGGATITTDTMNAIAYDCQYTYDGDVSSAVTENIEDLEILREHLFALADAWDATASALDIAINGDVTSLLLSIFGTSAFVSIISVMAIRRRKV